MRTRLLGALGAALISGCAPWPHLVTTVPAVTGQLTRGGSPVAGALIFAVPGSSRASCNLPQAQRESGAQGSFQLGLVSELRLIYEPLVSPLSVNYWMLCIQEGNTRTLGYLGLNFQARKEHVRLHCDFNQQYPQAERGVRGICQAVPHAESPALEPAPSTD